jgi:uncharacterized protein
VIVDVHTHVFEAARHFGKGLQADMERCGVDASPWGDVAGRHPSETAAADVTVVFGLRARATGWDIPNDFVAAHVARAPERMIFFAALDPADDSCLDELERCHRDLGAAGVKLSPLYSGVNPRDPRCAEIYRYCVLHGLPVLFHAGTSFVGHTPLDDSRPVHFDAVAGDFPELRMVLAHLAHPWESETIAVIRRRPHVYADLSALYYRPWQFYNSMRLLVEYRAENKVLFGSDYPFTTTGDSLRGVRNVNAIVAQSGLPPVPSEVLENIIHRDALALLGLAAPGPGQKGGAA